MVYWRSAVERWNVKYGSGVKGHATPLADSCCSAPGGYVVNHKLGQRTSGAICQICLQLIPKKYVCLIFKLLLKIVQRRSWREQREARSVTKKTCWFELTTLSALVFKIFCQRTRYSVTETGGLMPKIQFL